MGDGISIAEEKNFQRARAFLEIQNAIRREMISMKRWVLLFLTFLVVGVLTMGCAGYVGKETKVKCPKCGAVFTIDEGLKNVGP